MKQKISDVIAQFLENRGIRHVFGIIGAGNCHIFDSVARHGKTEIVCVHHEQAATMAMQTYYRTSGICTVALLTTGGGSTNGVTGVVSAWADSIPSVVISGNENHKFTRPDNSLRMYGVQGYDSSEMVRNVVKYCARVMDPSQILFELDKAFYIANSGRPGPVWIDVPMSIQSSFVETETLPRFTPANSEEHVPSSSVEQVLSALRAAKRPLLWLGHGIRLAGGVNSILPLLDVLQIPTLVSWSGIDLVDSNHPLLFGRAGTYGQRCANLVVQNCDFLLTIGTRLAIPQIGYEITELARAAQIAVVDIDQAELDKYKERVTYRVHADAKLFIDCAINQLAKQQIKAPQSWLDQCDSYRTRYPWVGPEHADRDGFINSYRFMEKLVPHFKSDQIVVTDMGTALLSGHQVLKIKPPQRLMTSQGLGEMGFGLPAAMGASFARNRGEVLCLNCDGGMMMNLQELQTIAHHSLPIKIIIFNNDGYLMIKHTQTALFKGMRTGVDAKSGVSCPDFSALAKVFDMPAFQIRTWEDFDRVIPEFQALNRAAICEVFMHPDQPFVPKLSLAMQENGTLVSPPLEDLSPLLPRAELEKNMIVGIHQKSKDLKTN